MIYKCDDEINYIIRIVQIKKIYLKISNLLKNYVRFMFLINNYAMKIRNKLIIYDVDLLINWQNLNEIFYRENKLYLFKTMRMNTLI